MNELRLGLFGDSIATGLGVRENRYGELICRELGMELVDYAVSGATVGESYRRFLTRPEKLDLAIVAHGVTEPIPRPTDSSLRFMPPRWRRRGWMDPRPYFSSRRWKRTLESIESAVRWRTKNALMRIGGSMQLMELADYEEALSALIVELENAGARVLVLGPPAIDGKFFPGAPAAQAAYASRAQAAGRSYIAVSDLLIQWEDYFADRFHPNLQGHQKISLAVGGWIESTIRLKSTPNANHE